MRRFEMLRFPIYVATDPDATLVRLRCIQKQILYANKRLKAIHRNGSGNRSGEYRTVETASSPPGTDAG